MDFATRLQGVETSAIREVFKLLSRPGIISFAGGFPDAGMFDLEGIGEATQRVMGLGGSVLQYGATQGYQPLREQLSLYMQNKGAQVSPEGLIVTTGSQQVLDLVGKTLISRGDRVIVEAPTFLAAIQCFRLYGAKLVEAPIDDGGVDVEQLEALIVQHSPKLIYLIPSFGNPHGALLGLERRRRVLELAVRYQVVVVEDDPYGDLYFTPHPPPPSLLALSPGVQGARDWLVYGGSLSKVLAPGLRVGWMVAPEAMLAKATMCKQFSDAHTSTTSQAIAACYLESGRMPANMQKVRSIYAQRAERMCATLADGFGTLVHFSAPLGGMFVWVKLGDASVNTNAFARTAVEHNVAFVPGAPFFATNPDHATLRLSFATSNLQAIEEGMVRLRQAYHAG